MAALRRERLDGGVAVLRLDRPEVRNALDSAALAELEAALAEDAADDGLRALVLSTTDVRGFCAGADVGEALDPDAAVARMEAFARVYAAVEAFPAPAVCVCVGSVVGAGAEIAAGCDLARAKDLIFTGRAVDAEEALALGLLHRVAPAARAEAEAIALARQVAENPPEGLRRLKALFRDLDGGGARVATENAGLVAWQRQGPGLPQRKES